jgi:hypothetical protein
MQRGFGNAMVMIPKTPAPPLLSVLRREHEERLVLDDHLHNVTLLLEMRDIGSCALRAVTKAIARRAAMASNLASMAVAFGPIRTPSFK